MSTCSSFLLPDPPPPRPQPLPSSPWPYTCAMSNAPRIIKVWTRAKHFRSTKLTLVQCLITPIHVRLDVPLWIRKYLDRTPLTAITKMATTKLSVYCRYSGSSLLELIHDLCRSCVASSHAHGHCNCTRQNMDSAETSN